MEMLLQKMEAMQAGRTMQEMLPQAVVPVLPEKMPETAVLLANRPANRLLYAGVCRHPCAAGGDGF